MPNPDVIVVAGGWSVGQYDRAALSEKLSFSASIGVNDSAILLPCNYALSMDRLWTEGRWAQVMMKFHPRRVWIRKGVAKNVTLPDEVNQFQHTGNNVEMTDQSGCLNGSNSGSCAVNLAWQWAARRLEKFPRVFLLGFDMQDGPRGEKHWYPNYPWRPNGATKPGNFRDWAAEYHEIERKFHQIGVPLINVNHHSAIENLPTISFKEFLEI